MCAPRRLLCACLLALLAVPLGASARSTAAAPPCSEMAKGWQGHVTGMKLKPTHAAVERRVILLVNRFRREHGLHPLWLDPGLRYAARARAVSGGLSLTRMARYSPSECIGQNLVRADGQSRATGIVRRWLHAPGARQVLLLPWATRIGVGVRVRAIEGAHATTATAVVSAARPSEPTGAMNCPSASAPQCGGLSDPSS